MIMNISLPVEFPEEVLPIISDRYGEAPPEGNSSLGLEVCKRIGISQLKVYKMIGKSVILVFKRALN